MAKVEVAFGELAGGGNYQTPKTVTVTNKPDGHNALTFNGVGNIKALMINPFNNSYNVFAFYDVENDTWIKSDINSFKINSISGNVVDITTVWGATWNATFYIIDE